MSTKFGEFLTKLAEKNEAASSETIAAIKAKLEAEHQAKIEQKIKQIFLQIEGEVASIKRCRRVVDMCKKNIAELEKRAENILAGKDV